MVRTVRASFVVQLILVVHVAPAYAGQGFCEWLLAPGTSGPRVEAVKKKVLRTTLNALAYAKGLPPYIAGIEESKLTKSYEAYDNFGEMGLAEIGISVRYNRAQLEGLNTGRPLIVVANHHLGIADGLALQYMTSLARDGRVLLFLARWIDELLPHAVYDPKQPVGETRPFGTAIPVEINVPKNDEAKKAEANEFNAKWGLRAAKALKRRALVTVFPAGHVASMKKGGRYPGSVTDDPWQDGYLNLARLSDADIVFAHVDAVNGRWFYLFRKLFGGADRERVIWFLGEALAKKGKSIDVYLSRPMSLDEIYDTFAQRYHRTRDDMEADPLLTADLMRQFTYDVSRTFPQVLDQKDSPQKKVRATRSE